VFAVEVIVERPAALDVHKATVTACVRVPGEHGVRVPHLTEFQTTVRGLLALRDWLAVHRVSQVVMKATGVYWKPVWHILEDDCELLLVNARHVKQVPGRKTDMSDAAWLCQLAEAGLLKGSFVPPKPVRALRLLTRYRKTQIAERQREANRLHKALQDTNIKLDCVASDILGVSGRLMLDALVAGTTDPEVLADLAKGRLRKKLPALRESLEGRFDRLHALLIGSILAHLDFLDEQIDGLSDAIEEQLVPFGMGAVALLVTIPGVGERSAQNILAEIGTDMSVFATDKHLTSWPGSAPAITSRPASSAPAARARAQSGSTKRSRSPRWPRPARRTATSERSTSACDHGSGTAARSVPSNTRSSKRSGTCCPPARPTATSAATTSHAATPNARPDASSPSSNASDTPSPCSRQTHRPPAYSPFSGPCGNVVPETPGCRRRQARTHDRRCGSATSRSEDAAWR
jgi:transposase